LAKYINDFAISGGIIAQTPDELEKIVKQKITFPIKFKNKRKFHVGYFIFDDHRELYIFICNKFSWALNIKWKSWKKYWRKEWLYNYPEPIEITVEIQDDLLKILNNISKLVNCKVFVKEEKDKMKINIKGIDPLAILKLVFSTPYSVWDFEWNKKQNRRYRKFG